MCVRRGGLVVQLVKLGWTKVCEKAGLPDYLDHLDQQNTKPKRMGNCGSCVLNAHPVSEGSMSLVSAAG